MKIPVEKITAKGFKISILIFINQDRLTEGVLEKPIFLSANLRRKGEEIKLSGEIHGEVRLRCSRCAEEFPFKVDSKFNLSVLPIDSLKPGEVPLKEKELDMDFYKNGVIDIESIVADQVNLIIPMKPLCRPDCKGICPVCGANRNKVNCGHDVKLPDPRLSQLKFLLEVRNGSA